MPDATDKILQKLKAKQIRRINLTKEDLQQAYHEREKITFSR